MKDETLITPGKQREETGHAQAIGPLFSSQSVHWPTPQSLYGELDKEFRFNFDPCPLGESEKDGSSPLFTSWAGKRVFCNPPYGPGIVPFLERAKEADVAVFLLPARTDTRWFHNLVLPHAKEILFVKGRLKFGDAKNSAPFHSIIAIYAQPVHGTFANTNVPVEKTKSSP